MDSVGDSSRLTEQTIVSQTEEAQSRHPTLEAVRLESGNVVVQGRVGFTIDTPLGVVADDYELRIEFPRCYPARPPVVFETEGKIESEFDHFMAAGNFCLGAPVEVRRRFSEHGNLLRFIEDLVVPYLFSYTYKREKGQMPFGELAHGARGLLEYYRDFFRASNGEVLNLLASLANDNVGRFPECVCGRKERLAQCHGPKLQQLKPHLTRAEFSRELVQIALLVGSGRA